MGRGYPISHSAKQKLNTRSSCEGELGGVDDLMPQILWTWLFLDAQGYGTWESLIHQDNKLLFSLRRMGCLPLVRDPNTLTFVISL